MIGVSADLLNAWIRKNHISLAMIYDRQGNIVWHMGRKVTGDSIYNGDGFAKSYVLLSIEKFDMLERKQEAILIQGGNVYESSLKSPVKAVMIHPINDCHLLYVDRTRKKTFSSQEIYTINTLLFLLNGILAEKSGVEKKIMTLAGKSGEIQKVRQLIKKYGPEREPVLITGETGVGKNLVASLIHQTSGRRGAIQVAHMPTIPESLFESEIFGYKKGAFTDARSEKRGLLAEAEGGTILLDEISEIPYHFQAKLLRFIETCKFRVLGESRERTADVRVIAATNSRLLQAVERGQFREDLYYRLSSFEIEIPPLRHRKKDIRPIVRQNKDLLKEKKIDTEAWNFLEHYQWPGNVRQLISFLKRAGILLTDPIHEADIVKILNYGENHTARKDPITIVNHLWQQLKMGESFWKTVKEPFLSREIKREEVKGVVRMAIEECGPKYCDIIHPLNIPIQEYKKFLNFLKIHNIMD
jgi:transcriptional regulator with PAS, ATPase and Fis domain